MEIYIIILIIVVVISIAVGAYFLFRKEDKSIPDPVEDALAAGNIIQKFTNSISQENFKTDIVYDSIEKIFYNYDKFMGMYCPKINMTEVNELVKNKLTTQLGYNANTAQENLRFILDDFKKANNDTDYQKSLNDKIGTKGDDIFNAFIFSYIYYIIADDTSMNKSELMVAFIGMIVLFNATVKPTLPKKITKRILQANGSYALEGEEKDLTDIYLTYNEDYKTTNVLNIYKNTNINKNAPETKLNYFSYLHDDTNACHIDKVCYSSTTDVVNSLKGKATAKSIDLASNKDNFLKISKIIAAYIVGNVYNLLLKPKNIDLNNAFSEEIATFNEILVDLFD
jgi:hypothetical protein